MDDFQFSIACLQAHKGKWPIVCEETGLDYSWLCKFAQGDIPNASYKRVKKLADYFRTKSAPHV